MCVRVRVCKERRKRERERVIDRSSLVPASDKTAIHQITW